jgi:hypothetical protein
MEQALARNDQPAAALAMLFTNAMGQVVFVDRAFLRMMRYTDAGMVAGEPLHKVLGLDQKNALQLLDTLRRQGQVRDWPLETASANGHISLAGVATRDESGNFIGADITLRDLTAPEVVSHTDVLSTRVKEALAGAHPQGENEVLLQLYFTTQIEALYVQMTRLVGLGARKHLDKAINDLAQKNKWAISMKDGHANSLTDQTDAPVFRALLTEAFNYGVGIIGRRVVAREMQRIDGQMDTRAVQLAGEAGLRDLFKTT